MLPPTPQDRQYLRKRKDAEQVIRHAHTVLETGITNSEQHQLAVESGRLLQVMTKNVTEFFKPLKQAIDKLKQPILDEEREILDELKTTKESLAAAIGQYERAVAAKEQKRLEESKATALPVGSLPAPVIIASEQKTKVRGKVDRVTWRAEVVDLKKLVTAVAAGEVPVLAIQANQDYLNGRADSDREGFSIPGVEARKIESIHFRA